MLNSALDCSIPFLCQWNSQILWNVMNFSTSFYLFLLFRLKKNRKYRLCICNAFFIFFLNSFTENQNIYYRLFWKHWSWIKRPIYSMKPIIKTSRYFRSCCCRYRQCFQVRFRPSRDIPYSVFAQVDLVFATTIQK